MRPFPIVRLGDSGLLWRHVTRERLISWGGLALLTAFLFLGGGTHEDGLILVSVATGIVLILAPPRTSPHRVFDYGVLLLLLAIAAAWIPWPESWRPEWWLELRHGAGIPLPATLSPHPWQVADRLPYVLVGLAWTYLLAQHRPHHELRKELLWGVALIGAGLTLFIVMGNASGEKWRYAPETRVFSLFPNKNQTAACLATCGVVAFGLGVEYAIRRRLRAIPALGIAAFIGAHLGLTDSRAGIVLFVAGVLLLLATWRRRREFTTILKVALPLAIIMLSWLALAQSNAFVRLVRGFDDPRLASSMRIDLQLDSAALLADSPLFGFGLGTFPYTFRQVPHRSPTGLWVRHPESDWMWASAEVGLVGLLGIGIAAWGIGLGLLPLGSDRESRFRRIALAAALVVPLHGFFDVSGHRLGTFALSAFLFSWALFSKRSHQSLLPPAFFRVSGLLLIAWAVVLGWESDLRHRPLTTGPYRNATANVIGSVWDSANLQEASARAEIWSIRLPLWWRGWFERVRIHAATGSNPSQMRDDLLRIRLLEPYLAEPLMREAALWDRLGYPAATVAALGEALGRHSDSPGQPQEFVLRFLSRPEYIDQLALLSREFASIRAAALSRLPPELFAREFAWQLDHDPCLTAFTAGQPTRFLRRMLEISGPSFFEERRIPDDCGQAVWNRFSIDILWSDGDHASAVRSLLAWLPVPEVPDLRAPASINAARMAANSAPNDLVAQIRLMQTAVREEHWDLAQSASDRILALTEPPIYVHYWAGLTASERSRYETAWKHLRAYEDRLHAQSP